MNDTKSNHTLTVLFGILFVVLLCLLFISRQIVLVSLIGLGIGVILSPLLNHFRNRFRVPRGLSALVFLVLFGLFISRILFGLWYLVSEQFQSLLQRTPEIKANLLKQQADLFDRYPWVKTYYDGIKISEAAKSGALGIFKGMQLTFLAMGGFLFALIIAVYTAIRAKDYFEGVISLFPPDLRPKTKQVLEKCGAVLRQWIRAQLIDMGIIGTLTAVGLWIAGIEYWGIFGLLTAVLGIIPYVGIFMVVVGATLITFASDPSQVPWVIAIFFATQVIENNLVLPLVMHQKVKLPEVPLLIFILFFGSWFGIIGVFIAPPVFAVLRTLYLEIYVPYIENKETPKCPIET